VDFNAAHDAHATVDVANIDTSRLPIGVPRDGMTFRSHSMLWDSLDGTPVLSPYGPGPGLPDRFYCMAHEIGRLIGLGHMGTLLRTPLRELAVILAGAGLDHSATETSGGQNMTWNVTMSDPGPGDIVCI